MISKADYHQMITELQLPEKLELVLKSNFDIEIIAKQFYKSANFYISDVDIIFQLLWKGH